MSTRNRISTSSATSKTDHHPSLALNESYDEEIAPLLTTIDRSKFILKDKNCFIYFGVLSSKSNR
jgi:hypothetical protein